MAFLLPIANIKPLWSIPEDASLLKKTNYDK
jgi:hypothetical protein